jgi:hypothetical protein
MQEPRTIPFLADNMCGLPPEIVQQVLQRLDEHNMPMHVLNDLLREPELFGTLVDAARQIHQHRRHLLPRKVALPTDRWLNVGSWVLLKLDREIEPGDLLIDVRIEHHDGPFQLRLNMVSWTPIVRGLQAKAEYDGTVRIRGVLIHD